MGWEEFANLNLNASWQYTDPVEGELFRLNYPDQDSIARALICQCELVDGVLHFYQVQRINANQREILEFKKPYCFTERRIAIRQIYGNYQWSLSLEQFMPINNATNVQQISATNPITTSTNTRITLTAGTATLVLAANALRKDVLATLETANVDVYITRGPVTGLTATSGAILLTGKGSSFSVGMEDLWTGQISAFCSSAAILNVTEGI